MNCTGWSTSCRATTILTPSAPCVVTLTPQLSWCPEPTGKHRYIRTFTVCPEKTGKYVIFVCLKGTGNQPVNTLYYYPGLKGCLESSCIIYTLYSYTAWNQQLNTLYSFFDGVPGGNQQVNTLYLYIDGVPGTNG